VQKLAANVVQERRRKMVQFKTIFVILSGRRSMSDYTAQKALFDSLNVPNQPRKHWLLGVGWEIAKGLEVVIANRTRANLQRRDSFHSLVTRSLLLIINPGSQLLHILPCLVSKCAMKAQLPSAWNLCLLTKTQPISSGRSWGVMAYWCQSCLSS
jgi:hypothetical protein